MVFQVPGDHPGPGVQAPPARSFRACAIRLTAASRLALTFAGRWRHPCGTVRHFMTTIILREHSPGTAKYQQPVKYGK